MTIGHNSKRVKGVARFTRGRTLASGGIND